jgi:rhodanese-related sulfurtransferase
MTTETGQTDLVPRCHTALAVALIAIGGLLSLAFYWFLLGGSDCVTPEWARQQLKVQPRSFALVDVRQPEAFAANHLQAAINWPLAAVLKADSPEHCPAALRGKTPLFICDVGPDSRLAARHIEKLGGEARFVRGGLQEWIHSGRHEQPTPLDTWVNAPGSPPRLQRPSPLYEQALAVLAFFVLKPIYTILALAVIIVLWGSRSRDMAALRWAMVFFFIGENCCAVSYLAFEERSYWLEYLHSFGMLLTFGFGSYALLEGIDRRIVMLSDPGRRCAAAGFCGRCIKHADVPCGLRRLFCLLLPVAMFLALMLPTAGWHDTAYVTQVFGQPYVYGHLFAFQIFENWYCGIAALLLFAVALVVLLVRKQAGIPTAKIFFAAGLGPLGFGGLRMLLGAAYDQHRVWFLFWEEGTELALIAAVCVVLWIFHRSLPLWINEHLGMSAIQSEHP